MRHELEYIGPSRDTLQWAVGCVATSYVRRIASLDIVQTFVIRGMRAVLIASWALNELFAARFFYFKAAAWWGVGADDYRKALSALEVWPSWSVALDAVAGLAYVTAAYCLMRKKISTLWILVAGTALNAVACVSQIVAVLREYGPVLPFENLRHTSLTYAWHMGVIVLLWCGFAHDRGRVSTP